MSQLMKHMKRGWTSDIDPLIIGQRETSAPERLPTIAPSLCIQTFVPSQDRQSDELTSQTYEKRPDFRH